MVGLKIETTNEDKEMEYLEEDKFKNRIKNLQECDHHNCRELS